MFTLLGGSEKKVQRRDNSSDPKKDEIQEAKRLFSMGKFPVVTSQVCEGRPVAKVLGLVCCRGFDSEESFFGMTAMAVRKGAQGIIAYSENIAFHPDGSKYFSCFGTAIMFQRDARTETSYLIPQEDAGLAQSRLIEDQDIITLSLESQISMDMARAPKEGFDMSGRPSEEDDPVLKRLLEQRRQSIQ